MSRRWFAPSVTVGAARAAKQVVAGRPTFAPAVDVQRTVGQAAPEPARTIVGPDLQLLGPSDVTGFDPAAVTRVEPPAGCADAIPDNIAAVEFADAALPWLHSLPGSAVTAAGKPQRRPWLVLVVLRAGEGDLVQGGQLPTITVDTRTLPDLRESWAWAHVEARVDDPDSAAGAITRDVRTGVDAVVARLLCPRHLVADTDWLACVVPATAGGVAAGLRAAAPADPPADAWNVGAAGPVTLPVYYSWRFRTGDDGSFEELARRIHPVQGSALPGFGSRRIDVSSPWLRAGLPGAAPEGVTVDVHGALRLPQSGIDREEWSDPAAMTAFQQELTTRLDAPAGRRSSTDLDPDRAVAPPLYGSHHTGVQTVPAAGWIAELNLQVQYRVAAALGCRYVQQDQEFLMARAWEQVGAITEANRLLAAAELAAAAGEAAQSKHVTQLDSTQLTLLTAPLRLPDRDQVDGDVRADGDVPNAFSQLRSSPAPDGLASTAFARLTRAGGALARRSVRAARDQGSTMSRSLSVLEELTDATVVSQPTGPLVGPDENATTTTVVVDRSTRFAGETLAGLLGGQDALLVGAGDLFRGAETADRLRGLAQTVTDGSGGMAVATATTIQAPAPEVIRSLRRKVNGEAVDPSAAIDVLASMSLATLADDVKVSLVPMTQMITSVSQSIPAADMGGRSAVDTRPLRPIMEHPHFVFPIGSILLSRWPEWAVPGISGFPENSSTLMETNSAFVEALLVGLNQEFNRELRWREYPTDEAGTPFARFWPGPDLAATEHGEIARWATDSPLGGHQPTVVKDRVVLLVRGDVLARFPGTVVLAAKATPAGFLPDPTGDGWRQPAFVLAVDDHTNLYCFDLSPTEVVEQRWMFVVREPLRGTQFGFDQHTADSPAFDKWANLTWDLVPTSRDFATAVPGALAPAVQGAPPPDLPVWANDAADMARIAFQQPFQLAFSPRSMLGDLP